MTVRATCNVLVVVVFCATFVVAQKATTPVAGESRKLPSGIEVVWIPAGEFMMGSTDAEIDEVVRECQRYNKVCNRDYWTNEIPKHSVKIKTGFWLGRYEVTQAQWRSVIGNNPSLFSKCGDECPVDHVSWDDIQIFLQRLNAKKDGYTYRLPSEAEWEYAARAGTTTTFAFGDTLNSRQANFSGNFPFRSNKKGPYLAKTVPVGSYKPNAWGLYDMHGNVWEWVQDIWKNGYDGLSVDGSANLSLGDPKLHVLRGGSWFYSGLNTRSAERGRVSSDDRVNDYGFRIVVTPR